ncbi:MAG: hypothetical protein HQK50_06535 [Oligoflexia bacterium]|nr:hypothetical protein [Oligoflexia bacterium]MBF0365209.1 hypothetical protein [Oligoflexia bacterium]
MKGKLLLYWMVAFVNYFAFSSFYSYAMDEALNDLPRDQLIHYDGDGDGNGQDLQMVNSRLAKSSKLKALRFISYGTGILVKFISPELRYSTRGPKFTEMSFTDVVLRKACKNNCFFQGIDAGAGLFLPFRYVLLNPNYKSDTSGVEKPFWVVDVFRVGINIGENGVFLQSLLGLDVPPYVSVNIGGQLFAVYEYINVRPIDDLQGFLKDPEKLFKLPLLTFGRIKHDFLEQMQSEDVLVLSKYLGTKGGVRVNAPAISGGLSLNPSVELQLKGELVNISRVTLLKDSDESMLVNFGKINKAKIKLELGLRILLSIPFATWEHLRLSLFERVFQFNLKNKNETNILVNNFFSTYPHQIPNDLMLEKRKMKIRSNKFNALFFHLFGYRDVERRSVVDYENLLTHETGVEICYNREIRSKRTKNFLRSQKKTIDYISSVNDQGDVFVSAVVELADPGATEMHFQQMCKSVTNLLPENFEVGNYFNYVNRFDERNTPSRKLGDLSLIAKTIFSDAALSKFFSKSRKEICLAYVEVNHLSENHCQGTLRQGFAVWAFLRDFEQAKGRFKQIKRLYQEEGADFVKYRPSIYKMLEEVTEIFKRYAKQRDTVDIIKKFSSEEDLYQVVEIERANDWLLYRKEHGRFIPGVRHLADYPEDVFELFSDEVHRTINFILYNNDLDIGEVFDLL